MTSSVTEWTVYDHDRHISVMKCCGHIDGQVKHLYQHIKVYISFIGQTEILKMRTVLLTYRRQNGLPDV